MLRDIQTLGDLCLWGARKYKSRKALELCRGDRLLQTLNFRTLAFRSRQLAGLFRSLGLEQGDRVMLLAENRPEWPMAAFGAALAGISLMPLSPRLPADREGAVSAGDYIRDLGERAGVRALCVTTGTGELTAGMNPALPRIYLDSPAIDRGWTGVRVAIGGVSKRLPLSRTGETLPKNPPEAGSAAVIWPDGTENSHRELLSLAAGGQSLPQLFPRDRIISVSSLAERGAFVLGILAAVLGGASLNLPAEFSASFFPEPEGTGEPSKAIELLRPSVLIGDAAFLENLYIKKGAPIAEGPLSRNAVTRPLAQYLGGRGLIRALGGNVRFYGFTSGPDLNAETAKVLSRVHLPRGRIVSPLNIPPTNGQE